MGIEGGNKSEGQRRVRRIALAENCLIGLAIPALWLWLMKRIGYSAFQGVWVDIVLGITLVAMLAIAVHRLSQWANMGWRESRGKRNGQA